MGFEAYLGNAGPVRLLRESLAGGRLPHAILLSGPRGVGKYTLALMLAQAANCLRPLQSDLPEFCGVCSNCARIAAGAPLRARVEEAVAAREELREADKKDTRVLVRTHPDVLVVPPDPPQLLIKLGQVRTVIREVYRVPAEARRAFFILTGSSMMKEAANSLLKVLEEPPPHATLMILSNNPGELLPTIRSRMAAFTLGPLPAPELETLLAERRPEWKAPDRSLAARVSEGAPGAALSFDAAAYMESRSMALLLLRGGLRSPNQNTDWSEIFRATEAFRAGAEGQQKTEALLASLRGLLRDLLVIRAGQSSMARNVDLLRELTTLAEGVSHPWLENASRGIDEVERGMRRNLLRSLSLDAMTAGFGRVSVQMWN